MELHEGTAGQHVQTYTHNALNIVGMMLSERAEAGAREKTKGIYLKVHDDGGMQWGDIQVQVVPSNSDGQTDTA